MDFSFSDDENELIYAAKSFLRNEHDLTYLRKLLTNKKVDPLWSQFAEMGLLGFCASENFGGLAQSLAAFLPIAEEAGYVALSEPFVETVGIVVPLLEEMGRGDLVQDVISGETKIGLISDFSPFIHDLSKCDYLLLDDDKGTIIDAHKMSFVNVQSVDPFLYLSQVDHPIGSGVRLLGKATLLNAAQLLGLSQHMLDMSVDYAKQREQFGRPIGSFQAIKHQLSDLHKEIVFARPILYLAAFSGGASVHNAKVTAIDLAFKATETAIQVHGGIGYTYESDLHIFMKRVWTLQGLWGDRSFHMRQLEDLILNDRQCE